MHGVFTALLVMLVLLALTPLFRPMPKAVLASIVFMAVKSLFDFRFRESRTSETHERRTSNTQTTWERRMSALAPCSCAPVPPSARAYTRPPRASARRPCTQYTHWIGLDGWHAARFLFRVKSSDFIAWVATFLSTLIFGVQIGIGTGIFTSMALIMIRQARPNHAMLGRLPGTKIFRDIRRYPEAQCVPGLAIFRFDASLNFANKVRLGPTAACLQASTHPRNHLRNRLRTRARSRARTCPRTCARTRLCVLACVLTLRLAPSKPSRQVRV